MANKPREELSIEQLATARYMVDNPTATHKVVSAACNVDMSTIWRWMKDERWLTEYDAMMKDKYRFFGAIGLNNVYEASKSTNEKIRLEASLYLSKLGGHVPVDKIESKHSIVKADPFEGITKEQIQAELQRYKQLEPIDYIDIESTKEDDNGGE